VVIDIILVCLGAIVVYGARFGFAHHLGIEIVSLRQLIHQHTPYYSAFLLLYVRAIVLAA